jgi:hypothetical protein
VISPVLFFRFSMDPLLKNLQESGLIIIRTLAGQVGQAALVKKLLLMRIS